MTTISVETPDGAILKVHRSGMGDPLVLVSGLGGTGAFWKPAIDTIGSGVEFICFDQRGIGASTRGTAPVTVGQLAEDVLTVCDALGLSRASFIGHSTGGCIVQTVAANAPDRVERLALSAAWFRPSHYMTALFEFRLKLLEIDAQAYAESAALLSYAPDWLEENWDMFDRASAAPLPDSDLRQVIAERIRALLSFDGSLQLEHIKAPTTILGTEDDMIVPAFLQKDLARHLPQAKLHMLENGGHFYPVSRKERFAALVREWMKQTA